MYATTVKVNAYGEWMTCTRCLEAEQFCVKCDCKVVSADQDGLELRNGQAVGCVLIEVNGAFQVTPEFMKAMKKVHWQPLIYS